MLDFIVFCSSSSNLISELAKYRIKHLQLETTETVYRVYLVQQKLIPARPAEPPHKAEKPHACAPLRWLLVL